MANDDELLEKARDLYNRLGGASNSDACIIRDLWLRLEQECKLTQRAVDVATPHVFFESQVHEWYPNMDAE